MANYRNIEEYRRKKRNRRIIRNILLAIFIVGLLFILLNILEIFKGSKLDQMITGAQQQESDRYPLTIKQEQMVDLQTVGSSIAVLTKSSIMTYSSKGTKENTVMHGYTNPVVKEGGKRLLVYDRGGNKLRVITQSSEIGEVTTESPILCADISSSGKVAVAMSYKSNTPAVIVYNENLKVAYRYFVTEDFTSVAFSEDGTRLALLSLTSPDGILGANLYELDTAKSEDAKITHISNIVPLAVSYKAGGGLFVVGKDSTVCINGISQKRFEYTGTLERFSFVGRDSLLLVTENMFSSYSALTLLSGDASVKKSMELNDDVLDVYSDGGRIEILSKKSLGNFDSTLGRLNEIPISTTCRKVVYNGEDAYTMGEDTIQKYSID